MEKNIHEADLRKTNFLGAFCKVSVQHKEELDGTRAARELQKVPPFKGWQKLSSIEQKANFSELLNAKRQNRIFRDH